MKPILRYPGAKWRLAKQIIQLLPRHEVYLEPFFGSGAVLFNKQPCKIETINDLDHRVVNLFRVIREQPKELARLLEFTPFARNELSEIIENHAGEDIKTTGDPVEDARRFVVRCSQCFGGDLADRAGWRNAKKKSSPSATAFWNKLPEVVIEAAQRLKDVQIECKDALELIDSYNSPECLIYADPPYPVEVRKKRLYHMEMQEKEKHARLLEFLLAHKGSVVLSGYDNELYNSMLKGWHREILNTTDNLGQDKQEVLWIKENEIKQLSLEEANE